MRRRPGKSSEVRCPFCTGFGGQMDRFCYRFRRCWACEGVVPVNDLPRILRPERGPSAEVQT